MKSVLYGRGEKKKKVKETKWFTQSHVGNDQRRQQLIPSDSEQSDVLSSMAQTNSTSPAALPFGLSDMESNASSIPTDLRAFSLHSHLVLAKVSQMW